MLAEFQLYRTALVCPGQGIDTFNTIKTGTGTFTLESSNSYSGGTTVNGGTLLANNGNPTFGSATGTGAVAVNSGGTLGGNGAIAGSVTVNSGGTLMPGNLGIGQLTLGSNLTMESGSTLVFQLGGLTAGTDYSQIIFDQSVSLGGTLSVTEVGGFQLTAGEKFYILVQNGVNPSTDSISGLFVNVGTNNIYTDSEGNEFLVNYDDTSLNGDPYANAVSLTDIAVPEPRTLWFFLLGNLAFVSCGLLRRIRT